MRCESIDAPPVPSAEPQDELCDPTIHLVGDEIDQHVGKAAQPRREHLQGNQCRRWMRGDERLELLIRHRKHDAVLSRSGADHPLSATRRFRVRKSRL